MGCGAFCQHFQKPSSFRMCPEQQVFSSVVLLLLLLFAG
jgi:hypothetical protein